MWESFTNILTSNNGIPLFILVVILVLLVIRMGIKLGKAGLLFIHTKHFQIGNNVSERELIRRQIECAHDFIMSIEGKIVTDNTRYNGYFTKYILERVYDKVIEWIMSNHITINQLYIQDKQDTILNLIYALPINDDFKTPEFKNRVENWVKELIERLVNVKVLYGCNSGRDR
jgi:hypothetical protein